MSLMNNTKKYEDNWPVFEKFLGYLRYVNIKKYIDHRKKNICLDIGCGFDGRFLRSISKKIERGYGVDIRANENIYGNVKIINNKNCGGNIPLDDKSVDRVFMLAVLEHLPVDSNLVEEGARVLKKEGLFILTTPTLFSKPILEFLAFKLHLISEESILEHKHYWSKNELINRFEKVGLKIKIYRKFQMGCNQLIVGEKI